VKLIRPYRTSSNTLFG